MSRGKICQLLMLGCLLGTAFPTRASGCEGSYCHSVQVYGAYSTYYAYPYRRPICPIGDVGPGCIAPVRKAGRLALRATFRTGVAVGRFLFGRRRYYY